MADIPAHLKALQSVGGISALKFNGVSLTADVTGALTDATIDLTMEGASTVTMTLHDSKRKLLKSGIFGNRVTCQLDNRVAFELVQVRKAGDQLTVVFEDLAVAALRRHTTPRKVMPGAVTHVDFARTLVAEEPWIKFNTWPGLAEKAKVELARGQVATEDQEAEPEDTWTAIGRLADERGWSRWMRDGAVFYLPQAFLFLGEPTFKLNERAGQGVDNIDFDFDIGKPVASMTAAVRIGRWQVPVGTVVEVTDLGPANGKWLVTDISRSLFSTTASVTLSQPKPTLPEPEPPPAPSAEELGPEGEDTGGGGGTVSTGASSGQGYQWPLRGTITSGYGQRRGRLHAGIDIAVSVGTPIGATKAGTVTFAGTAGGYGYAVYIDHGGVTSRYGHLSRIDVRRGQTVERGQKIGLSGGAKGARGAGNSSGPHLHFEIRPGDRPADPRKYLP